MLFEEIKKNKIPTCIFQPVQQPVVVVVGRKLGPWSSSRKSRKGSTVQGRWKTPARRGERRSQMKIKERLDILVILLLICMVNDRRGHGPLAFFNYFIIFLIFNIVRSVLILGLV